MGHEPALTDAQLRRQEAREAARRAQAASIYRRSEPLVLREPPTDAERIAELERQVRALNLIVATLLRSAK